MTISIASRKAKARTLQKYVRDLILAYLPLLPDDVRSTGMGQSGVDLQLSPKARSMLNYDIECKNDENKSVWHSWKCTTDNVKQGKPLLFIRKNRHETLAVCRAVDFMQLIERLQQMTDQVNIIGQD